MFKLKKIELLGFKSFGDRTRLEFTDGVAAIVGPNGCGKSNLSDAINWVLGEQSARTLRGERMADVIFNGTGTRPPTGMAEVSLTLVDPEYVDAPYTDKPEEAESEAESTSESPAPTNGNGNSPPLKHRAGEIVVTRRLFRSGESEYLINGEISRLRDIQDLFMGTGLGPESYAIIEQGRIGQILSSKPSDRRAILEEAAGVSKFKTRKRLAEAKLESSRANLARITDILEEVIKQVNSLKRQASKARRFKEMHEELRGKLKVVLASRWVALEAECRRLAEELRNLQEQCTQSSARLEELEREQKVTASRYEELEAQLTHTRRDIAQGDLDRQRLESRLEQLAQQSSALEAREAEAARDSEQLTAQVTALGAELAELDQRASSLVQELAQARENAARLASHRDELAGRLSSSETQMETCRQAMLAAVSRAADLRNQLVQAEESGLALERQATRVGAEKASAESAAVELSTRLEDSLKAYQYGETTAADSARALAATQQSLDQARARETERRALVESLRQEFSAATARKQTLEESLARHAYTTESVRRLLSKEIHDNGHSFRPMGLLADFVEVSPGYEEVVEEFLQHDLDCVVVERHDEARSGIEMLRSEGSGRSTFFVTRVPTSGQTNGHSTQEILQTPGVKARVRDLVSVEARLGLNGDVVLPALENAYLVETPETAESLAVRYPECHFLTADGQHYHHRLVTGGRGASAGPLALRRDFRDLERRTVELEAGLKDSEAKLAQDAERVAQLDADLERLTETKLEAEKGAILANEKLRQAREAHDREAERLRILSNELATLTAEHQGILARQGALRAELEAAGAEQARSEQELAAASASTRDLRVQLDQSAAELAQAQAQQLALEERTRALESERARLAAQHDEVRSRIARLTEQVEAWQKERQGLQEETEATRVELEQLQALQQVLRERLTQLETESQVTRTRRDEMEPQITAARTELDALREKRSEVEVAQARAESDRAHHAQTCRDELSTDPSQLGAELPPESILSGEVLQAAEEEARALKTRIENLGPVNMMALEELQEAEQRYAFLETQRQDLLASIEDTQQAIREIDQVSRQQFMEAFKAINANFAESFRTLFGGGIGQMRLADENDPDSGLDIVAQPPGKRLQNVLLLSGGEKALAALALLIAIFRYTPSPFCVLDEVDAPLDESNVDRFTRLIREMSRHTQFILITHNKRTMEIAKFIYGVTMEEPGVSKIVSVQFDEIPDEPVAVPA